MLLASLAFIYLRILDKWRGSVNRWQDMSVSRKISKDCIRYDTHL